MTNKTFRLTLFLLSISGLNLINAIHDTEPNWQEFKYRGAPVALDHSGYLTKVNKRMIEIFEENHVSGANLPILDQSIYINETAAEFNVEGTVILYDGFVNKIESIVDNHHLHISKFGEQTCTLGSPLHLYNVSIVYDVIFKFKDYEGTSMFVFTFNEIHLVYEITENLKTNVVTTSMELQYLNCKGFQTKAHPYGKYAQMGLKGLENGGNSKFCDNIKKSVQRWNLHECLQQAVNEIGFTRVCYYC